MSAIYNAFILGGLASGKPNPYHSEREAAGFLLSFYPDLAAILAGIAI
jgi:hypothetical protein